MAEFKTIYTLEKELKQLEEKKEKKEKEFNYNFNYMLLIGGFFIMGATYIFLGTNLENYISHASMINSIGIVTSISTATTEILLALRGKKLSNEIHLLGVDVDEKKIDIVKTRQNDIEKSSKLVDEILNRKDAPKTYNDDYSQLLNYNTKDLEEAGKDIFEMFNGKPKNINPLKEVEESEMKLYVLKPHNSTTNLKPIFFDNADEMNLYIKENGISNENIMLYTVEYKRHFADRTDVIVINSLSNNSKTKYMCAIDSDGYAEYDYEMSVYSGKYRWYFNYGKGYLDSIYEEFRKKGITFEREINSGISQNRSEAIKMLNKTRKKI